MRQAPLLLPRGQKGSKSEGWETALRVLSLVASKTQLDLVTRNLLPLIAFISKEIEIVN